MHRSLDHWACVQVRPKPGRAVLMDQDLLHRVSAPSPAIGSRPRYSLGAPAPPLAPCRVCSAGPCEGAAALCEGTLAFPISPRNVLRFRKPWAWCWVRAGEWTVAEGPVQMPAAAHPHSVWGLVLLQCQACPALPRWMPRSSQVQSCVECRT